MKKMCNPRELINKGRITKEELEEAELIMRRMAKMEKAQKMQQIRLIATELQAQLSMCQQEMEQLTVNVQMADVFHKHEFVMEKKIARGVWMKLDALYFLTRKS